MTGLSSSLPRPNSDNTVKRRWLPIDFCSLLTWAVIAGGLVAYWQPLSLVDRVWSDVLLVSQERPADPRIVIVTLTNVDIRNRGIDRLDRVFLAQTLERFSAGGARRVLLDLMLPNDLSPAEAEAMERAAAVLGPERLAVSHEPMAENGLPSAIASHVTPVDLRIGANRDGYFREFRWSSQATVADPITWLASGTAASGSTPFDLRVDARQFTRLSLSELHDPAFDLGRLRDKRVILSTGRDAARMRVQLPITGEVDRGTLLAMATQAKLTGYDVLFQRGQRWQTVLTGCGWLVGLLLGWRSRSRRYVVVGLLVVASVVMWATSYLIISHGTPSHPALVLSVCLAGVYAAIAVRLKLPQMVFSSLSGDLSPEEAWAWRGQLGVDQPVVLFGPSGRIKRANAAAVQAFNLSLPAFVADGVALAKSCSPDLGVRAKNVTTAEPGRQSWDLIWPHGDLPLVLFNNVTAVVLEREKLRQQLLHDPLTQTLNRRGFEEAAAELQRQGSCDYAILFMDMNGFKQVNDQQGHEMGDRLLQHAAQRFGSTLRPTDKLSRWGGDEYAVLMVGQASWESVAVLASRLESVLREPIDLGSVVVKVGVAVGFAVPERGEAYTAVLQRADEAMYARKAFLKSQMRAASGSPATPPLN